MAVSWGGWWIWTAAHLPPRNAFVRFRRRFTYEAGPAHLHLTADSRYTVYVNGAYLGQGPVRAWPDHWRYDSYNLAPLLRPGENVLAVLVQHLGDGTFQYVSGPPGLLAQIETAAGVFASDGQWRESPDQAFAHSAPRISVQQGFEEQYDARIDDAWTAPAYDDSHWPAAVALRPADDGHHRNIEPRGIPFLTLEPTPPQRVLGVEPVRSIPYRFTVDVRPCITPGDRTSNIVMAHAYLGTRVWSPESAEVILRLPHKRPAALKVNGTEIDLRDVDQGCAVPLRAGWNNLALSLRGAFHLLEFVFCADGPPGLRFSAAGDDESENSAWAVIGPFDVGDDGRLRATEHKDPSLIVASPVHPVATYGRGEEFWEASDIGIAAGEPYFQVVRMEQVVPEDVFVQAATDLVVAETVRLHQPEGLLSGADWTTVYPPASGADCRLLLDYGQEVVGFTRLEVDAPTDTIIDWHNFEFIQPDGRRNLAEGMNNSFRYVCREGYQTYQTFVRRGFRYSYLILRNLRGPVRLRRIEAMFNSYPQARRGSFASSDAQLDRIWLVGAHTLRCCAEDTYTDCPTYEQTHWVGDARNEALIDWAINGDPRLWYRCLEQAGESLERSPLVESHVPSAWVDILPAWSFLWMRSCWEYALFTGDRERSRRLLRFVDRNVAGIEQHLNAAGLFEIRAWNMFDWAAMDTPDTGIVTHQNCLAVHALGDAAHLADWLDESGLASRWRALAGSLVRAINEQLWSEAREAYADCRRGEQLSDVFSQQTQTVAYMSGVAAGGGEARERRCREVMRAPPNGFVRAGSPFFEFFLLEAFQREARSQEFLDTIRRDWGFMVDAGATTFWEMWTHRQGRLTRSHCHGWSAAPTFFLSSYTLGVRPGGPGFSPVVVEPHPGNLTWCRGQMPTPLGDVEVQWENPPDAPFSLRVHAPSGIEVEVLPPRDATITLRGRQVTPGRQVA
jgi:hypothetical protein